VKKIIYASLLNLSFLYGEVVYQPASCLDILRLVKFNKYKSSKDSIFQNINFGIGYGNQYGFIGFKSAFRLYNQTFLFFSVSPLSPYVNSVGVESDLTVLKSTKFRTHVSYGTVWFESSSYSSRKCVDDICQGFNEDYNEHIFGLSFGIDYFLEKAYRGLHIGLDISILNSKFSDNKLDTSYKNWHKEEISDLPRLNLSLGYQW